MNDTRPNVCRQEKDIQSDGSAFTLVELLVVVTIIGIVASMILSSARKATSSAQRTVCVNNLRQVNFAMQMYVEEQGGLISATNPIYFSYKDSLPRYLAKGNSTESKDKVFVCPADDFDLSGPLGRWYTFNGFTNVAGGKGFYTQPFTHYSSYTLNQSVRQPAGTTTNVSGVERKSFAYINAPHKTVLIGELSGATGLSAHDRRAPLQFDDPPNVMGYVDGHVSYIKMYWNGVTGSRGMPWFYEPPSAYSYKWSSDERP